MKIVFLVRRFYPDIGGVEKHVYELSKRLLKLGHTVTIITENTTVSQHVGKIDEDMKKVLQRLKIHRILISSDEHSKKYEIWRWMWMHKDLLTQADIIHAHDVFFWYLPFRFFYPRRKVFMTFHGYEGYPITRKAIVVRKISEVLSRGNICIGDFIKKWYGTSPDYVSYGAVESFESRSKPFDLAQGKNHESTKESAVFIGRLDRQTGIEIYCKAYQLLKKQMPKFELLVVGDGECKINLPKDITYKGFDPYARKYFENYRYAFVSRYLTILEAMIAKRLVLAVYDNSIKKDYLTMSPMAAFMVIAKTPDEIAEAVSYYLDHPENEKDHIEKAYQWAKEQTWEKMVDLYLSLWKK
ncbi:glycosyltransferase family 4 protein [soil metagenome]